MCSNLNLVTLRGAFSFTIQPSKQLRWTCDEFSAAQQKYFFDVIFVLIERKPTYLVKFDGFNESKHC